MASPQNSPATLGAARTRQMASVAWSRTDKLQQAYRGPTPPQSQPGKNSQLMLASDPVQEKKKDDFCGQKSQKFDFNDSKSSPLVIPTGTQHRGKLKFNGTTFCRYLLVILSSLLLDGWIRNMLRRAMMQENTNTPWSGKSMILSVDLDLQKIHLRRFMYTTWKKLIIMIIIIRFGIEPGLNKTIIPTVSNNFMLVWMMNTRSLILEQGGDWGLERFYLLFSFLFWES